jgi:four helix bundle protein
VHFLGQALGSLREVGYLIDLSRRLGFLDAPVAQGLDSLYQESAATLAALIQSLRQGPGPGR